MKTYAVKKNRSSLSPRQGRRAGMGTIRRLSSLRSAMLRHILRGPIVQPKLTISKTNDKYEQEAEQVADVVMRMPVAQQSACPADTAKKASIPAITGKIQSTDRVLQRAEDEGADEERSFCLRTPFPPGQLRFSGLSSSTLTDIAVINEADFGGLIHPVANGVWYDADGFWYRHRRGKSEWFKVPGHCDYELTGISSSSGSITGYNYCCNWLASLHYGWPRWSVAGLDHTKSNPFV